MWNQPAAILISDLLFQSSVKQKTPNLLWIAELLRDHFRFCWIMMDFFHLFVAFCRLNKLSNNQDNNRPINRKWKVSRESCTYHHHIYSVYCSTFLVNLYARYTIVQPILGLEHLTLPAMLLLDYLITHTLFWGPYSLCPHLSCTPLPYRHTHCSWLSDT